jgi:hypothetical protein
MNTGLSADMWVITSHHIPTRIWNLWDWIFGVSWKHLISSKCFDKSTWTTVSLTLWDSSILHSASSCHAVRCVFQLYPVKWRASRTMVHHHEAVVLQHIKPLTFDKVHKLRISMSDITQLEEMSVETHSHYYNINMLLAAHEGHIRLQQQHHHSIWYW